MLNTILSFLPFIAIIYLLLIKKLKAFQVMILTYFLTILLSLIFFKVDLITLVSATGKGFLISIEVFMIIFSVLLLYYLMKITKQLDTIKEYLESFSQDKQIQIILIGFFVVAFFEGIAGFGTPAAIAAPLLIIIGIQPITAVILTLVADSVPVTFGAFGTPIIVGIQSVSELPIEQITILSAYLSGIISLFIPLLLLILYNLIEFRTLKNLKPYLKIALIAGLSFAIPFVLTAIFIGPELPSVVSSIFGFIFIAYLVKKNIFIHENKNSPVNIKYKIDKKKVFYSLSAYFSLIVLFIISRINLFNFGDFLKQISINIIFPREEVTHALNLYHPWFLIFLIFLIYIFILNITREDLKEIVFESFQKSKYVLITLIFTLAFVQVILFSNLNTVEFIGIAQTIGETFSKFGIFYIFFAPFIGAFGAFIAGSATVSNIIFSSLQESVAIENLFNPALILALQNAGSSAGNMIAIHNIIAVLALVGLANEESNVLKVTLLVAFVYCIILGLLGLLFHFILF